MSRLHTIRRRFASSLAGLLLVAAGSLARGQNVNLYYSSIAWTSSYVAGQTVLIPVPNATIAVCTYPANAIPCTNYATVYYGPIATGDVSPTNPLQTDQYGNFGFWAGPGYYQYTVTNSLGQSAGPYTVVLTGAGLTGTLIPVTNLLLKGANTANLSLAAIPGTDYVLPSGSITGQAGGIIPAILYSAAGTPLPTCTGGIQGRQLTVSDATSPTYMTAYTSGGGVTAAVLCSYNGSTYSWLTH